MELEDLFKFLIFIGFAVASIFGHFKNEKTKQNPRQARPKQVRRSNPQSSETDSAGERPSLADWIERARQAQEEQLARTRTERETDTNPDFDEVDEYGMTEELDEPDFIDDLDTEEFKPEPPILKTEYQQWVEEHGEPRERPPQRQSAPVERVRRSKVRRSHQTMPRGRGTGGDYFADPGDLRRAFVLKEVLDAPVSKRRRR